MATQEKKQPETQPAEDMFGRPTRRDAPMQDRTGSRQSTAQEPEEQERHLGGIDDIPDGDGPRSDRGTNPLPEVYWADYPGGKP